MSLSRNFRALDTESRFHPERRDCLLLSAAVVGPDGFLFHTPIKPVGLNLEEIRSIGNLPFPAEVLLQASPPAVVRNILKELLRGYDVLVWNEEYEASQLAFLNEKDHRGRNLFCVQDVMKRAAPYVKSWNPYFSAYEYPSLSLAARAFNLEFSDPGWHDARSDAQMTLDLWVLMDQNPLYPFVRQNLSAATSPPTHEIAFQKTAQRIHQL